MLLINWLGVFASKLQWNLSRAARQARRQRKMMRRARRRQDSLSTQLEDLEARVMLSGVTAVADYVTISQLDQYVLVDVLSNDYSESGGLYIVNATFVQGIGDVIVEPVTEDRLWIMVESAEYAPIIYYTIEDSYGTQSSSYVYVGLQIVTQQPPVLAAIPDQTIVNGTINGTVTLSATDPDNDPLTYSASAQSIEYYLDQTYQFSGVDYLNNYFGYSEKFLLSSSGTYYYIVPTGKLLQYDGSMDPNTDTLIEQLSTSVYYNTSLLHSATANNAPAALSMSGKTLTINPTDNHIGRFVVTASVSDGQGGSDSKSFLVNVLGQVIDTTAPVVTTLLPTNGSTVIGPSLDIDVTFSETVTGVDASDLVLSGAAAVSAAKSTPTHLGNNQWRFRISNLVAGSLSVSLAQNPNSIEDAAGNDLARIDRTYTVTIADTTAPVVTSLVPANGSTVTGPNLNIDVTFSEAVTGVDASDLVLNGAAAVSATKSTPTHLGNNQWRFSISNLVAGSLSVSLAQNPNSIEDAVGNDLARIDRNYTVTIADTTAPVVTSLVPTNGSTVTGPNLNIDVTFSEIVIGVDAWDLFLGGMAAAAATKSTPIHLGNNVWRFAVANLSTGTLSASLGATANSIEDTAGNDLVVFTASYSVIVPAVQQPPVLAPITDQTISNGTLNRTVALSATDPNNDTLTYSASAQSMEYYLDQKYGFYAGTTYFNLLGQSEKWVISTDGYAYFVLPSGELRKYDGYTNPLIEKLSVTTYANVSLLNDASANNAPAVLSVAGNIVTINPSDTYIGKFAVTASVNDGRGGSDSKSFFVNVLGLITDTTAPVVTATSHANGATLTGTSLNFDVTFSETVYGVDASDLWLTGAAASSAVKSTPIHLGNNTWRFAISNLTSGPLFVNLANNANTIEDAAGNDLFAHNSSFTVDTQPPVISSISPGHGTAVGIAGHSLNIDLTFSEAVTGVDASDLVLSGAAAVSAVKSNPTHLGNNVWRFAVSNLVPGTLNVAVAPYANSIKDVAGNDFAARYWSYSLFTDTVVPWITSLTPDQGTSLAGSTQNIDVTFSEAVSGVDASDLVLSGSAAVSAVKSTPVHLGNNVWRFTVSNLSAGTLIATLAPTAGSIEDPAGNDLASATRTYTIEDRTAPTVTSFTPAFGSQITSTSVNIDITFSESAIGVDASDLKLSGSAATTAIVAAPVSLGNNVWRYAVTGLATGSLNVLLAPDENDIQDSAGNDLAQRSWAYIVNAKSSLVGAQTIAVNDQILLRTPQGNAPITLDVLANDVSANGSLNIIYAFSYYGSNVSILEGQGTGRDRVQISNFRGWDYIYYAVQDAAGSISYASAYVSSYGTHIFSYASNGALTVAGGVGDSHTISPTSSFLPTSSGNYSYSTAQSGTAFESSGAVGTQGITLNVSSTSDGVANWSYTELVTWTYDVTSSDQYGNSKHLWGGYSYLFSTVSDNGVITTTFNYSSSDDYLVQTHSLTQTSDQTSDLSVDYWGKINTAYSVIHVDDWLDSGSIYYHNDRTAFSLGSGTYIRPMPGGSVTGTLHSDSYDFSTVTVREP